MYQIDDSTAVAALPTPDPAGTPGYFTDGNAALQQPATIVPADFFNTLMLELLNLLTAAGITPSKTAYNQVLLAIETLIEARSGNYLLDTGSANAYVVAMNPAVTSYPNGLTLSFRATHANTGASTLNAGGGAVPLLRDNGTATQAGDIALNAIVTATYDSTAAGFLVTSIVLSQLGALAQLGIGKGLSNVSGALTVDLDAPLQFDSGGNVKINLGSGLENSSGALTVALDAPLQFDSSGNVQLAFGAGLYVDSNSNLSVTGARYVNANANVYAGEYIVDTSAGSFTLTLPPSPTKGTVITFMDAAATWGLNAWTLAHNGKTIMGQLADLSVNLSDQEFSIWYNGADWRLV